MFLATRDLAYAKGRFALIGGVIALITLLVVMLTGLAAGLAKESVSAIDTLPSHGVDQIGFSAAAKGQKVGYDSSHVESKDIDEIKSVKGVTDASPLTITQGRASVSGVPSAVAVFAVPDGSFAAPKGVKNGSVVVGKTITKDAALKEGESISFNNKSVRVAKLSDDASYQHQPVVWMTESDAKAAGLLGQGSGTVALVKTGSGFSKDALTSATGLDVQDPKTSLGTISAYQAENGSLTLMRVMLMLVSALVVGAFFTVWTIQRTPDLAVLKAMARTPATSCVTPWVRPPSCCSSVAASARSARPSSATSRRARCRSSSASPPRSSRWRCCSFSVCSARSSACAAS